MPRRQKRLVILTAALALSPLAAQWAHAQDETTPPELREDEFGNPGGALASPAPEMEEALERMSEVIAALDEDAERTGNNWQFSLDDRVLLVVTDTNAGRMRIITPIAQVEGLPEGVMMRLMQANFDTALDARYAVADGLVWGTFIHPLDSLTTRDFASGILQTKSLADTFGTTFSSSTFNYRGGDSGAILEDQLRELLEELERRQTT